MKALVDGGTENLIWCERAEGGRQGGRIEREGEGEGRRGESEREENEKSRKVDF